MPDQAGRWVGVAPSSSSFLLPLVLINGSMLIMVVNRDKEVAMLSETHLTQKERERERETALHLVCAFGVGRHIFFFFLEIQQECLFVFSPSQIFVILMVTTETHIIPFHCVGGGGGGGGASMILHYHQIRIFARN